MLVDWNEFRHIVLARFDTFHNLAVPTETAD